MSKQRRGKKLITQNPKENFTKVPNSLLKAKGLTASEKLILIQLHYYPANWVLAYTRLAKELNLDKSNLIDRWESLKLKGFIIEDENTITINYNRIEGGENLPELKEVKTHHTTKEGGENPPSIGGENLPTKVVKTLLNGGKNPPIEEDTKEEDLKNKTKEEDYNSLVELSKPKPSVSKPVDDNKALDIVQSNIEVKTSTAKYSINMRNAKYYKLIFKQNFTVLIIEEYFNDFSIEEKNILNEYYQIFKGRLKENYIKENYLYLQLMYSLFLSKSIEFTNLVLDNSSIDRMDLNVIDSLYEDYCSINKTPIVTNQNIIASNVAPCATDTSMMKDSNNSTDAHASGEISAPANGHTTTSRSTPSKIESLKMERKAIERHAKKVALELADQFFGEY